MRAEADSGRSEKSSRTASPDKGLNPMWIVIAWCAGGLIGWYGGYCYGWLMGEKDTERRWSDAVRHRADYERAVAKRETASEHMTTSDVRGTTPQA